MLGLPPYLPISNVHDALLFSSERAISAQQQRPGSMWPRKRHALIGKPGQGSVQACVHSATGVNRSVVCLGLSQKTESKAR